MKFKFVGEHVDLYTDKTVSTVSIDLNADTLGEVIHTFEDFLRGCGYVIDGSLDIINEEEYNDSSDDVGHSDAYYDFDRNKPADAEPWKPDPGTVIFDASAPVTY